MKIFIIRHAESINNERKIMDSRDPELDMGLSKKGKIQAKELILKLREYNFDVFITSPLKRTIETLKPFLKTLSSPIIIVNELTLERDVGKFAGTSIKSIIDYCKKNGIEDRVSFKPKEGESILETYERAKKFLEFLKERFDKEKILICGHKNFITCFETLITKKTIENYYSYEPIKNGEIRRFEI